VAAFLRNVCADVKKSFSIAEAEPLSRGWAIGGGAAGSGGRWKPQIRSGRHDATARRFELE
jgi:hypothetical protein